MSVERKKRRKERKTEGTHETKDEKETSHEVPCIRERNDVARQVKVQSKPKLRRRYEVSSSTSVVMIGGNIVGELARIFHTRILRLMLEKTSALVYWPQ